MPFRAWIFVFLFISGISGVPANNNFEQVDSVETIEQRDAAAEWHFGEFALTMQKSKLIYPQMDKSGSVRSEKAKADPDPIYFSDKRGRLGILSEDRRTVTRVDLDTEDKLYALAYTARPVKVGELFEITIEEDDPFRKYNNLCFGMTAINPDTLPQVPIVPINIRAPGWYFIGVEGVQCDIIKCHGNYLQLPRNATVNDTLGAIRQVPHEITFFFNKEPIATVQIPPEDNLYGVADLQAFRKLSITS